MSLDLRIYFLNLLIGYIDIGLGINIKPYKSLFKAISIVQQIALGGFPTWDIEPFKLSSPVRPISKVEIEFKTSGKYYAYGVEFSKGGIHKEWLNQFISTGDKKIFTRESINSPESLESIKTIKTPEAYSPSCPKQAHKFEFGPIQGDEHAE